MPVLRNTGISWVKQIPLYVTETTGILRKLDETKSVPDNAYLVSPDVKYL